MSANGTYAKLFSSIVHSTVWREPSHVRIVWVTILAIKDSHGIVAASVPGLADVARVSLEECEDAIARLSSPDKYSRTKDLEGRRIVEVDGGWRVVNHDKYRSPVEDKAAADAKRAREYRARRKEDTREIPQKDPPSHAVTPRHAPSRDVTDHHVESRPVATSDQIKSDQIKTNPPNPPAAPKPDPTRGKPADPMRASFRTQCPDRLEFTERQRGLAKRGSIDILLSWASFRDDARAQGKFLSDWDSAFSAHLAKAVERIERSAAYRANGPDAKRGPQTDTLARPKAPPATPVAPPTTETRPEANPEASRKLTALVGRIG